MVKKKSVEEAPDIAAESTPTRARVQFDFIKSQAFRVIHVDGIWGGVRPDLSFHLNLYNERHSIPQSVTIDFDPDDVDAEQFVEVQNREAVIREVEVCAIMDLETAEEPVTG